MDEFQRDVKRQRRKSSEIPGFHPRCSTREHDEHIHANQKAVSPLFDICVKYVSSHLHLVESFHDFPDLIGETIFSCAAESRQFSETSDTSLHALALFCNAYAGSVLDRVNLQGCHLGVADYTEHLCLFKHLTHLDLTSCGLGDNHELMVHIAASNSLECLYLNDNGVTSSGIQKMTAPLRVLSRGPMALQIFSLADNPGITVQAIRYLKCFPALKTLDVTGTGISQHEIGEVQLQLGLKHTPGVPFKPEVIVDTGWASSVVRKWMQKKIPRDVPATRSEAHKFYKKAKDPALLSHSLKTNLSPSTHDQDRLQLCFTKTFISSNNKPLVIKNKTHVKSKVLTNTKIDMQRINVNHYNKKNNMSESSSHSMSGRQTVKDREDEVDAEDEMMMKSYTTNMNSGKLDLWHAMNSERW